MAYSQCSMSISRSPSQQELDESIKEIYGHGHKGRCACQRWAP